MTHKSKHVVDVRDHLGRALHGHARQPRRDDGAARDPPRPARRASAASSGPSTPTRSTFAVLLLTGAALGDRFGRRRLLRDRPRRSSRVASAAAALAPSIGALDAARALQGLGGAIVMPLTLTILSAAVPAGAPRARARRVGRHQRPRGRVRPARRRRRRLRHLVALDLLAQRADRARARPARAAAARREPTGPSAGSTCPASGSPAPACSGSSGASSAATASAGRSPEIVGALVAGALVLARVRRLGAARAGRRCCRCASSATARSRSRTSPRCSCRFGMFGSIFLLAQFFQTVQGYSPLGSGLRILPWTAMPMIVAPIAGALSDRIGGHTADGRRARAAGGRARLDRGRLDADDAVHRPRRCRSRSPGSGWRSSSRRSRTSSSRRSARRSRARPRARTTRSASSAASSASRCSPRSSRTTAATRAARRSSNGMTPAVYVGAAVVALGSVAAFAIKRRPKSDVVALEPALEAAA